MPETRTTRQGRVRPAPRIEPTYGKRAERKARKRREAEERNARTRPEDRRQYRLEKNK